MTVPSTSMIGSSWCWSTVTSNHAKAPTLSSRRRWFTPGRRSRVASEADAESQRRIGCKVQLTLLAPLISAPFGIGDVSLPGDSFSFRSPLEGS